jgi:hypothetical protein
VGVGVASLAMDPLTEGGHMPKTGRTTLDGLKIGDLVRDMNSFNNVWGRIVKFDADDFAFIAPLNGDDVYGVWVGCLSKNAYRDHRILREKEGC